MKPPTATVNGAETPGENGNGTEAGCGTTTAHWAERPTMSPKSARNSIAATFVENDEGVHMINPLLAEFTLCGDAFDIVFEDGCEGLDWRTTAKRTVTCKKCAAVVAECRGVRISPRPTVEGMGG